MTAAVVIDVETTGIDQTQDRVVEIAILSWFTGDVMLHSLVNPQMPIPEHATAVHGITNLAVAEAPTFCQVASEAAGMIRLAEAVIGHNVMFDRGILAAEFARCHVAVEWPIMICTLRVWDIYEPRPSRDLQHTFQRFVDEKGFEGSHGALADARATQRVIREQIAEFDLEDKLWADVDPEQAEWWGSSNHVVWREGRLVMNFGKHRGAELQDVPRSYWSWIVHQDFPAHVKRMADYFRVAAPRDVTHEQVIKFATGE